MHLGGDLEMGTISSFSS